MDRFAPTEALAYGADQVRVGLEHTCRRRGGAFDCWGRNELGQLGDGTTTDRFSPRPVAKVPYGASGLAAGDNFACGITGSAAVCWGLRPGTWPPEPSVFATPVAGVAFPAAITAGVGHACLAAIDGSVWCWGSGVSGQLGDGSTVSSAFIAVQAKGIEDATAVAAGATSSCALAAGRVRCWGNNAQGQLGDGTTVPRLVAVDVAGLP